MSRSKKPGIKPDRNHIFRLMRALVEHGGNIRQTALAVGMSQFTLRDMKNRYYEEYLRGDIAEIGDDASVVEAKRLLVVKKLDGAMDLVNEVFTKAMDRLSEVLDDDEKMDKMPHRDLVQLINVLAPYVAEKKAIIGTNEPENLIKAQYNQFITNIINNMGGTKNEIQEHTN